MVADPRVGALWLCGPNFARIENVEEIVDAVNRGEGELAGIACEKPLARTVAEAKRVAELVKQTGVAHGYLENQAFAPAVTHGRTLLWARGASLTGRPYLARAAERSEEHTSELQSRLHLVCRLLLEKKKKTKTRQIRMHKAQRHAAT